MFHLLKPLLRPMFSHSFVAEDNMAIFRPVNTDSFFLGGGMLYLRLIIHLTVNGADMAIFSVHPALICAVRWRVKLRLGSWTFGFLVAIFPGSMRLSPLPVKARLMYGSLPRVQKQFVFNVNLYSHCIHHLTFHPITHLILFLIL